METPTKGMNATMLKLIAMVVARLILIPVALSYTGVGKRCARLAARPPKSMEDMHWLWRFLLMFTHKGPAIAAIVVSIGLAIGGFIVAQDLAIGDLDPGAPELRADSRYNQDVAYVIGNYSVSTDVFAVIVKTWSSPVFTMAVTRSGWTARTRPLRYWPRLRSPPASSVSSPPRPASSPKATA